MNIEQLLTLITQLEEIPKLHKQANEHVIEMDKQMCDHNHALELDNLNYKERAKLATVMKKNRIERRKSKNIAHNLEPLVEFLQDENMRKFMNKFKTALHASNGRFKTQDKRTYIKKGSYGDEQNQ